MKKISALNHLFPKGGDLLCDSMLNKGSAFTDKERENLGLVGLLPPRVNSLENQTMRVIENLRVKTSSLEKYVYLTSLQDRNKTLFYRVLLDYIEELIPIVYTPTVGQACLEYGHVFRSGVQGLFIASEHKGRIREVLGNRPSKDVRIIVRTDRERILGLEDPGCGWNGDSHWDLFALKIRNFLSLWNKLVRNTVDNTARRCYPSLNYHSNRYTSICRGLYKFHTTINFDTVSVVSR